MDRRILILRCLLCAIGGAACFGCEWFVACIGFTGLGLMMPVFAAVGCARCLNSASSTQVQVDVSGITNGSCSFCSRANGTFVLTVLPADKCFWRAAINPGMCNEFGGTVVDFSVVAESPGLHDELLEVTWYGSPSYYLESNDPDCMSWSAVALPTFTNSTGNAFCTWTGATVTVTTL
jgi:hypothetical protein